MMLPINPDEMEGLLVALQRPGALLEACVLAVCGAVAWLVTRALRGAGADDDSIWFGRRLYDGVLFPVLLLVLAASARVLMTGFAKPAVFKLAIPVLVSLVLVRLTVHVLRASFPDSRLMRTIERSFSWAVWLAAVLWVTGVLPLMLDAMEGVSWTMGGHPITLRRFVEGLVMAGLVMVLALWVSAGIEKKLLRGTGSDLSLQKMAANLVRMLLLFVGLLLALSAVGIDLTALSVFGGAIGVGLGFGLQKIAANYISGFVILAERSLRIGDMVRIDNFDGRITDIRTRYTLIRALNGREAIVPNEMLITQRVENSSLAELSVLVTTNVQVAYGTDVRVLKPLLEAAVAQVTRVLPDPAPAVHLLAFGDNGMDLAVNFWITDPENGQGNVRSEVNFAVLKVLNEQGIEIPFPQRVVHAVPVPASARATGP